MPDGKVMAASIAVLRKRILLDTVAPNLKDDMQAYERKLLDIGFDMFTKTEEAI